MIYQELDSCKINHFLSGFIGLLIVSCEPSESVKPCECSFHDPSQRLGRKAVGPVGSVADLKFYQKVRLYLLCNLSAIPSVHKNFLKCGPKVRCLLAEWIGKFGIMLPGTVNCPSEDKTVAVNHDVAFDALYFFIGIKAVVAVTVAPFYALCVQRSDSRALVLPASPSDSHDCLLYEVFYMAVLSPLAEILINRLPFRKIFGEHSPLATADQQIQDCLEYGAQGIFAVSAIIFKEHFVYIRPLTLGQMCLIEESYMHDKTFFLLTTLWLRVFRAFNLYFWLMLRFR